MILDGADSIEPGEGKEWTDVGKSKGKPGHAKTLVYLLYELTTIFCF